MPPETRPPETKAPAYLIRTPEVSDAEELARLHVLVWQQAYRGLLPQDYLDSMRPEGEREESWRERVADFADGSPTPSGHRLLVAREVSTDTVVGFCQSGPARDEDAALPDELMALNVLAAHHGTGVAHQLVSATVGDRPAYLWVLTGNDRAIAFYRKLGFELDGVSKRDQEPDCTDLRMVRG